MDQSLDEIIASKKKNNPPTRGRGGSKPLVRNRRGRGAVNSASAPAPRRQFNQSKPIPAGPWRHDMFPGGNNNMNMVNPRPLMGLSVQAGPIKLLISNLDYGVTDSDIRELFGEFGSMESASVHFDISGCSLGSAQVIYTNRAAAMKAKDQYDGVHLDRRPMRISIEGDNRGSMGMGGGRMGGSMMPAPVKRLENGFNGPRRTDFASLRGTSAPMSGGARRGRGGPAGRGGLGGRGAGGRGGGRGGRGGASAGREKDTPKSAAELDQELENYLANAKRK